MQTSELQIIEISLEYFPVPSFEADVTLVKGQCTGMISKQEKYIRGEDEFQKDPFKSIAKYFRNQSYTDPVKIRTPEALYKSLQYLKDNFFVTILNDKKKIQKIVLGKNSQPKNQNSEQTKHKQNKLEKILSILERQSQLGLVEESSFYPFRMKIDKQTDSTQLDKTKSILNQIKTDKLQYDDLIIPEKILVFLETRLQAIRCELYAQGIVYPKLVMELLKCEIFLHTLRENEYQTIGSEIGSSQGLRLVGLDVLLDENIKQILNSRPDFQNIYQEALVIAVFRYGANELTKLIQTHDLILTNQKIFELFQLRLYIERGNYHKYFKSLQESDDVLVTCMLLTHLERIRQRLCNVLKSTKIDVKKSWLAFLLGFTIKPEEENEIINLSKNSTYVEDKKQKKEIQSRQKQLKSWINLEDLFSQIIL